MGGQQNMRQFQLISVGPHYKETWPTGWLAGWQTQNRYLKFKMFIINNKTQFCVNALFLVFLDHF